MDAVVTVIGGDEAVLVPGGMVTPPAGGTRKTPDLVDIMETGSDVDADLERRVVLAMVLDLEPILESCPSAVEGTSPTGGEDVLADRPPAR